MTTSNFGIDYGYTNPIYDAINSYYDTLYEREYVPVRLTPRDIIDTFGIETAKEVIESYQESLKAVRMHRLKAMTSFFKLGHNREGVENLISMLHYNDSVKWYEKQIERLENLIELAKFKPTKNEIGPDEITKAKLVSIENYLNFDRQHRAICLWHSERHPSLYIYRKENRVHCFSCGVNKDVIDVVQELNKVDFISAVRLILQQQS